MSVIILSVLFLILGLSDGFPAQMRTGFPGSVPYLPYFAAIEKGFFRDEGIEMETVRMGAGSQIANAWVSGDLDVMPLATTLVSLVAVQGQKAYATMMMTETLAFNVYVRRNLDGVTSMAHLKGRRVGITRPGGSLDLVARALLEKEGLTAKDIIIRQLGSADAIGAALVAGEVDAGVLGPPFFIPLVKRGDVRLLVDVSDALPPMEPITVNYTEEFLRKKPNMARAFNRALLKGLKFVLERPEETVEVGVKVLKMDRATSQASYEFMSKRWSRTGKINRKAIEETLAWQMKLGLLKRPVKVDEIVDERFTP